MLKSKYEWICSIRESDFTKCKLSSNKIFLQSVLGGFFLSLAAHAALIASYSLFEDNNIGLARLVSASIFPLGLVIIVLSGFSLFTGNVSVIASDDSNNKIDILLSKLKLLVVSYIGNLIGALSLVFLLYFGNNSSPNNEFNKVLTSLTSNKLNTPVSELIIKGFICNILVCFAVLLSQCTNVILSKVALTYFPVFLFILGGYEHSIANMYYIPYGLLLDNNSYVEIITVLNNFLFVTFGNLLGGIFVTKSIFSLHSQEN